VRQSRRFFQKPFQREGIAAKERNEHKRVWRWVQQNGGDVSKASGETFYSLDAVREWHNERGDFGDTRQLPNSNGQTCSHVTLPRRQASPLYHSQVYIHPSIYLCRMYWNGAKTTNLDFILQGPCCFVIQTVKPGRPKGLSTFLLPCQKMFLFSL
jgi:hypothetical protein